MSQGKMKAFLHNQAIEHLLKKISPEKPDAILIDQFAKENIYFGYLKGQKNIQQRECFFSYKSRGNSCCCCSSIHHCQVLLCPTF